MPADGSTFPAVHAPLDRLLNRIPPHFSALQKVCFLYVADDTPPALRLMAKRERARAMLERDRARDRSGVCWSGMDADPYDVASVEELVARAADQERRMASPRGRFLAALPGVDAVDPAKAEQVRAAYRRDLADERQPLNTAAVGAILTLLNEIPGKDARTAIDCLAELLMDRRAGA